jgi:hypothetical protein
MTTETKMSTVKITAITRAHLSEEIVGFGTTCEDSSPQEERDTHVNIIITTIESETEGLIESLVNVCTECETGERYGEVDV